MQCHRIERESLMQVGAPQHSNESLSCYQVASDFEDFVCTCPIQYGQGYRVSKLHRKYAQIISKITSKLFPNKLRCTSQESLSSNFRSSAFAHPDLSGPFQFRKRKHPLVGSAVFFSSTPLHPLRKMADAAENAGAEAQEDEALPSRTYGLRTDCSRALRIWPSTSLRGLPK